MIQNNNKPGAKATFPFPAPLPVSLYSNYVLRLHCVPQALIVLSHRPTSKKTYICLFYLSPLMYKVFIFPLKIQPAVKVNVTCFVAK